MGLAPRIQFKHCTKDGPLLLSMVHPPSMGDPLIHLAYMVACNKVNEHPLTRWVGASHGELGLGRKHVLVLCVCIHVHMCMTLTCISIAAAWLLEILNGTGAT